MFIGTSGGYRSIRTTPDKGKLLLMIGGEGHKVGTTSDTKARYEKLEQYGRDRFGIQQYAYRWSTQDTVSFDKLPFIGKLTPISNHVFVATGFSLWGMTKGTLAGMLLTDLVLGVENPWAELYDSLRAKPFLTVKSLQENIDVGIHWAGDRLKSFIQNPADGLAVGEAKVFSVDGKQIAAYCDEQGAIHARSAVCTHLACIVNWNDAEKSWDCPCHGARFDYKGKVIQGPAINDLEPAQI
jgi:Rieske Fe-S protein